MCLFFVNTQNQALQCVGVKSEYDSHNNLFSSTPLPSTFVTPGYLSALAFFLVGVAFMYLITDMIPSLEPSAHNGSGEAEVCTAVAWNPAPT